VKNILILSILVISLGVLAVFTLIQPEIQAQPGVQTQAEIQIDGKVPTKDEILATARWGVENPEILDARLLLNEEAAKAAGVGIQYNDGLYKPDDPVWAVAVKSGNASIQLPDIGQGDTKYAGILWLINAANGQAISMSSIDDTANDVRLQRLKELPDRDGMIKIQPQPISTIAQPEATPTAVTAIIIRSD